ncbi:kinase-like protein, partial [Trifolium pratense]
MPYQVYGDHDNSLVKSILYVRCPNNVQNSSGIYFDEGGACMNITQENSFYVNYITYGYHKSLSDLGDECRIEFMYLTSWPLEHGGRRGNNISCSDIRRMMFYGFEVSWFNSLCKDGLYWYRYVDKNSQRLCASLEEWSFLEIVVTSILINI